VTGGALVPLLTLGIPGDVVTAILMGSLMLQGLTPGPQLFTEHATVIHGIYAMMILANTFMLILGLLGINAFVRILRVPPAILMPCVLVLTFVGAFAINHSTFDMQMALLMGFIGYVFTKTGFPVPPVLLGIILCPIIETNFRRAVTISKGDLSIFLRPISLTFILIAIVACCWPVYRERQNAKKRARASGQ
jgi:putative tricarboxylic transport membrane protein